jgi:thioredoxin reductase (NADPH)
MSDMVTGPDLGARVAVIGAGVAGLVCAAAAASDGFSVEIFERTAPGGQLNLLGDIAVFAGAPVVSGAGYAAELTEYAMNTGVEFRYEEVTELSWAGSVWRLGPDDSAFDHVVVAAGSEPDLSAVPGAAALVGRGVSLCATCDGPLFRGQTVAVAGQGRDAIYEAIELVPYAAEILVLQTDRAGSPPALSAHPSIQVLDFESIVGLSGNPLQTLEYVDTAGTPQALAVTGFFPALGRRPGGQWSFDPGAASAPIVIGDARTDSARTVLSAIGEGAAAAVELVRRRNAVLAGSNHQ